MAKFRVRVNNKGKRWRKGHSSSSNPATNLHRRAAQDRFFQVNLGESNLTKEAVEKHDAFTGNDHEGDTPAGTSSKSATTFKTFETFASDWSMCSNKSFNKLLKNFNSNSAMHKEMLAVLAAIAEVIKENGGQETSTEYFGALMTALEASDNDDSSIMAILNVLGMGIKSVPKSVLQVKFGQITKVFMDLLVKYADSNQVSILRPLLGCLSVVLRAQEAAVWNEPSTINVLNSMLAFVTFSKPKVRKAAQHGIAVVVHGGEATPTALGHVGRHMIALIEEAVTGASGSTSVTTALHALTLLKDIMIAFPKKELKICIESVFKLMTLNNVLVTCCCLRSLHGMLGGGGSKRPSSSSLPPPTNARVISALFDFQPAPTDVQPTQAWLAVLQEAYLNLAKNDLSLCVANIGRLFTVVTELYLSERVECMNAATRTLDAATTDCLGPATASRQVAAQNATHLSSVVNTMQSRLASFQYHAAWTHILHLIAALFRSCGEHGSKTVLPLVRQLGELRDSNQFAHINELENAIGSAVRTMGPQLVLQVIPFQITDKKRDFKRSWLLPVLKDNIRVSTINFFTEYFLPLATSCRQESDRLKGINDQVGALSYDLLHAQIWALLPSFASQPTDIATSFPIIAKALGGILSSKKELRMSVMSCLRKLVCRSLESNQSDDLSTMARYAKNYLPILFNIYTTPTKATDEEGIRLASYETIKVYLKVVDSDLSYELFERATKKVEELEGEQKESAVGDTSKESVLDLVRALLCYQSAPTLLKLYGVIEAKISADDNPKEQKKYYRQVTIMHIFIILHTSICFILFLW
ncbi:hypothetical protein AAG570_009597 [Ranatra chinensis]|uniref:Ribosomal RNA-processing protein 12-like conserved domain-containing protein n=1 Tax=Ranatra chinensis TaxID=642074 RepID=A0ABD0Z2I2_9HEMI